MLEKEYEFYKKNRSKLVDAYKNKYVVIKDNDVIGVYDSKEEAAKNTIVNNTLGTFLIKLIEKEDTNIRFYNKVFIN